MMSNVYAHGEVSHQVSPWMQWSFEPHIILVLGLLGLLYARGLKNFKKGPNRDDAQGLSLNLRASFYYLGLFLLLLALISPIDVFADKLAWVHMLQHTIILMVSAPLMVVGMPAFYGHWSFSEKEWHHLSYFRTMYLKILDLSKVNRPILAWLIYSLTLWIWHIPRLYEAALKNELLHDFQHILFFVTSFFFWKILFDPFKKRFLTVIGILYPFVASLHSILLGVLMTLSPKVWYQPYVKTAPEFGLTPLEDQQIAGFIMWMPAGITYAFAAIIIVLLIFKRDKDSESGSKI